MTSKSEEHKAGSSLRWNDEQERKVCVPQLHRQCGAVEIRQLHLLR
jgi:hypothetical protein